MGFVQNEFVVDVSDLDFGSNSVNNTKTIRLALDALTIISPETLTIGSDQEYPFDINLSHIVANYYELSLIFNKGFNKIKPSTTYKLIISGCNIYITVVYAYKYNQCAWKNIDEDDAPINCIELGSPILSKTANKLWMSIFRTALAAWQNVRMNMRYYFYKGKYLNDILQFTTITHVLPENSTAKISYDENGRISKIIVTYTDRGDAQDIVMVTYKYATEMIERYCGDPQGNIAECSGEMVIDEIHVNGVNQAGTTIRTLGKIKYLRELTEINVPNAPLYDQTQSPISAINQLSHFRKYKVMAITGYEVTML